MATFRPLVVATNGVRQVLPSGDFVSPAALGSGSPSSSNFLRGDGVWAAPTAAEGVAIAQTGHGFSVGNPVYFNGTSFVLARADVWTTLAQGLVGEVTDANNFRLYQSGTVTTLSGLVAGTDYYLSAVTAGAAVAGINTNLFGYQQYLYTALSATQVILDIADVGIPANQYAPPQAYRGLIIS